MNNHKFLTKKLINLEQLAIIDELSGLFNYRYFLEALSSEVYRAKRYNRFLSLIVIDVNHFKIINDNKGHEEGNKLIKEIADILIKNTRKSNIVCRYGGDEFVIILPETNYNDAKKLVLRLKEVIYKKIGISISLGIASFPKNGKTVKGLFNYADREMFKNKGE